MPWLRRCLRRCAAAPKMLLPASATYYATVIGINKIVSSRVVARRLVSHPPPDSSLGLYAQVTSREPDEFRKMRVCQLSNFRCMSTKREFLIPLFAVRILGSLVSLLKQRSLKLN